MQLYSQRNKTDRSDFGVSFGSGFSGKIQASDYSDFNPDDTYNFTNKQSLLIKGMDDYYVLTDPSGGR